ncbi:hypothetical protein [Pseudooceanicola nitratireducens]|uniref:hypothetical protein n=1 Tax=Pseudooceanicola nitratireducens TaxID=517719 RepID=UPI00147FC4FA|nr:hypothetical protein [Pseudooceanicola nitratireducens]MEC7298796.1 hypothetical protein [Pseudomonadota bacterium]
MIRNDRRVNFMVPDTALSSVYIVTPHGAGGAYGLRQKPATSRGAKKERKNMFQTVLFAGAALHKVPKKSGGDPSARILSS